MNSGGIPIGDSPFLKPLVPGRFLTLFFLKGRMTKLEHQSSMTDSFDHSYTLEDF